MKQSNAIKASGLIAAMSLGITGVSSSESSLPDPDGKPADMSKPVQVYILMGQSNMVGAGKVQGDTDGSLAHAVQEKNKYPYLVDDEGNEGKILDAMFAISDAEKHPELKGHVATVYSNPISMGGSSNGHYGGNAETYMNVGEAMGEAMVELLEGE